MESYSSLQWRVGESSGSFWEGQQYRPYVQLPLHSLERIVKALVPPLLLYYRAQVPIYCANGSIRGVLFLKMHPCFYCVVKGSTVHFSMGAFLSRAVKEVEPCTSLGRKCETDSAHT